MERILIDNAVVVDGTGTPGFPGAVVIEGDRIAAVLRETDERPAGVRIVDAGGASLCPGFIDLHNHSDVSLFVEPWMDCYIRQGVTTMVVGNCGGSGAPPVGADEMAELSGVTSEDLGGASWSDFAGYLDAVDAITPSVNIAALVGHGTVRQQVMGGERRPPTEGELASMQVLVREAMEAGAVGISTGLIYVPGMYADTGEITSLTAEVAPFGGLYASHVRGESELVFDAVSEAIDIGRDAGVGTHVSHLKVSNEPMWGRAGDLLALLDARRDAGDDVSVDQYPYTAWETSLAAFLPPWAPVEDLALIVEFDRERLQRSVLDGEDDWEGSVEGVGWERVQIVGHRRAELTGRSIAEVAADEGGDGFDAMCRLLVEDPATSVIGHAMHEDDVRTIRSRPDVLVGSDGVSTSPDGPLGRFGVHPRYYGTFPRVLGPYVREGVIGFESAIAAMTSRAADRFRLGDRGRIRPGAMADLVVVDRDRVDDRATYEQPHAFPDGIELVMVAGRPAWNGSALGERAGRVVRLGG